MNSPIGEYFRLSPNELGRQRLQLLAGAVAASLASTAVRAYTTVPSDETWWVAGLMNQSIPGAGQAVTRMILGTIQGPDAAAPFVTLFAGGPDTSTLPAVQQTVSIHSSFGGPIMLPGGTILCAASSFSAGAAANSVSLNYYGLRTPRGNAI
jgi:hypothetical protein